MKVAMLTQITVVQKTESMQNLFRINAIQLSDFATLILFLYDPFMALHIPKPLAA